MYGANEPPLQPGNTRAVVSLVLGVFSLVAGWTLLVPLVGLVLGVSSRHREPAAGTMAWWGIALNLLAMLGWLIAGSLFLLFGTIVLFH